MSKKAKITAAFLALILAVATVFPLGANAMYYPSVDTAPSYTDDEDLKSRMETIVETFPSAFLDENGEGIVYGGAEDCLAYARWVYDELFDTMDYYSPNIPGGNRHYNFVDGQIGETKTPEQLRSEFKALDLKFGSMIYFGPAADSVAEHAMIVLSYDENGVTVIHGSWGGKGRICMTVFTWQEMIDSFGQLCWVRTPWEYPNTENVQAQYIDILGKDAVFTNSKVEYIAKFTPEDTTLQSVIWSVENISGEATIDNNGILTPKAPGLVKITVASRDLSNVVATKTVRINKPTDVINITATPQGLNTVVLQWDKCRDVDGYMIYRSTTLTNSYTPIATINNGSECYFEDKVNFGQEYFYKICSYKVKHGIIIMGRKSSYVGASLTVDSAVTPRTTTIKNGNF